MTKTIMATMLIAASFIGTAHAEMTRAEVQQELVLAKNIGMVTFGELEYPPPYVTDVPSTMTRAEVEAERQEAKKSGLYTFGELEYPPNAPIPLKPAKRTILR